MYWSYWSCHVGLLLAPSELTKKLQQWRWLETVVRCSPIQKKVCTIFCRFQTVYKIRRFWLLSEMVVCIFFHTFFLYSFGLTTGEPSTIQYFFCYLYTKDKYTWLRSKICSRTLLSINWFIIEKDLNLLTSMRSGI